MKQAKQLKCDVNSKQFRDTLRYVWMPRLMEQIQASCGINGPYSHGQGQSTLCNAQARSEPCVANPSMLSLASSYSSGFDHVQASSLSDSSLSYNVMGGGGCWSSESAEKGATSTPLLQQRDFSGIQAFEPETGFGGADLWTDENIWFLQQQLADDLWSYDPVFYARS